MASVIELVAERTPPFWRGRPTSAWNTNRSAFMALINPIRMLRPRKVDKSTASGNDNAGRSETMATAASFSSVVLSWGHGVKSRLAQQPVDGEERQYNTASH